MKKPIEKTSWRAGVQRSPFTKHLFFSFLLLSVGEGSSWQPTYCTFKKEGKVVGPNVLTFISFYLENRDCHWWGFRGALRDLRRVNLTHQHVLRLVHGRGVPLPTRPLVKGSLSFFLSRHRRSGHRRSMFHNRKMRAPAEEFKLHVLPGFFSRRGSEKNAGFWCLLFGRAVSVFS